MFTSFKRQDLFETYCFMNLLKIKDALPTRPREWYLTRLSTKAHWDLPFHPGPWRKLPKRSEIDVDVHRYYAEPSAIWGDFAGCHTWSWKPLKHVLGSYGQWTMPMLYRVITCLHVSVSVSKWRSFAQTCSAVKATWTIVCLAILQSYQRFA